MKSIAATILFLSPAILSFGQNTMTLVDVTSSSGAPSNYFYYCDNTVTIDFFTDSINNSGADINGLISTTSFQPSPIEVSVTWGDGNTTVHTGIVINQGQAIQFTPAISHTYSTNSSYTITYLVTNTANQSLADDVVPITVGGVYYFDFYSFIELDCDSNGVADSTISTGVPILLTSLDNGATFLDTLNTGSVYFTGVPSGNYTYQIDPSWLASNGYNPYYLPANTSFYLDTTGMAYTTQIMLFCNDSLNQSQQNCVSGYVYCDANQNYVWDPGEQYLSNVPVNIFPYSGNSFTVYTNQNGYFQSNFLNSGGQGQYTIIEVNNNWLTQNGYGSGYYVDTILNTTCGQGDTSDFAIQCPTSIDTNCVSGFVFCDDNNNSSFDNNESPITNAPVNLQIGNYNITVYTDSFGNFNYCSTLISPNSTYMASLDSKRCWNYIRLNLVFTSFKFTPKGHYQVIS